MGVLEQGAEIFGAAFEVTLLVAGQLRQILPPSGVRPPNLLDEIDGGAGEQAGRILQVSSSGQRHLQHILPQVRVLLPELSHPRQRPIELKSSTPGEFKVKGLQHVSLHVEQLARRVLAGTGRDQLPQFRHLVRLFEFCRDEQRCHSYQLQLAQRHRFC